MTDLPFDDPHALTAVQSLRTGDRHRLDALRATLAMDLTGHRCLVLGSAPGANPPIMPAERCIAVNGAPFVASKLGIQVDWALIVGFTTSMKRDISRLSMKKLQGLTARHVLFVSAGDSAAAGRQAIETAGFGFSEFHEITALERAAIIGEVCSSEFGLGPRDSRVSNGVFAAILALWAGAGHVTLAGISLDGGHAYAIGTPRYHLDGDTRALRDLARCEVDRIDTTSATLSEATGLANCPGAPSPAADSGPA
jgi:hypothetical protein